MLAPVNLNVAQAVRLQSQRLAKALDPPTPELIKADGLMRQNLRRAAMRALPKPGQQVQSHYHPVPTP